jgi:RNA polymerase sigma-70 factor (ECF subfamily)
MAARASVAADERELVERLRAGDEAAFAALVDAHSSALLRLARMYVRDRAVAEEVVQETWLSVVRGIDGFEGRSSLKTWIFRILANTARTRGQREARSIPFSAAANPSGDEPSVEPDRFLPADHRYGRHWALGPTPWETPEDSLLAGETRSVITDAIAALPAAQREVITLRDVEGWPSEHVCEALGISEGNQRVLLHRARSKVRGAIEGYLGAVAPTL